MAQPYEDSSLKEALDGARGDDAAASVREQRDEWAVPPAAPSFASPRIRRTTGALQATGARLIVTLAEFAAIVLTSLIAGFGYHQFVLAEQANPAVLGAVGLLAAIFYAGGMAKVEGHQRLRPLDSPGAMRDVTLVWGGAILCVTFFAFALKAGEALSRGSMLTFLVIGYLALVAIRTIGTRAIAKHYRPGRLGGHQLIVVGAEGDPTVEALQSELSDAGYAEPCVVLFNTNCGPREWQRERAAAMMRVLGFARTAEHGEICVAAGGFDDERLKEIVTGLQVVPRAVRIIPNASLEHWLHFPVRSIGTWRSIELQKAPLNVAERAVKRALDIALAGGALIAFAPFFAIVALAIRSTSRGPALFRQARLGHRSRPFDIYKFRTMTVAENDAEVKQAEANDRRVTPLGKWLRKTSIDELPQLINVLRGEMSLVGPRPHAVAHDKYYGHLIDNYDVRQHVKPGITGWAQVNGYRGETASPELMRRRVEFDIWYAKNAGILLDFRILMLTLVEVVRQRNAY